MFVCFNFSYWNCHKNILEEKIRQLINEINQLKQENKINVLNRS